jgi:hypothetical protein
MDVQRIDTEPMTRQQHNEAVSALAALIHAWSACDLTGRAHGAQPLPLHRTRSDTVHADADRHPRQPAEGNAHDPRSQPARHSRRQPAG